MIVYAISVCPQCRRGPLVFDADGLDAYEGMTPRSLCECGAVVLIDEALRLEVRAA